MSAVPATIRSDETSVFPRLLDFAYPNVARGEGVWLETSDGRRILDACGGGAMVATLGHGRRDLVEAAAAQAERLSYVYYHHFTNDRQEEYARRLLETAAPEMARVRFVTGGSEANEMALRLARQYHVERGDERRWRVISPAQAYHGATLGMLALSGRRSLRGPYEPYLADHPHVPPSNAHLDASGEQALAELDRALEEAGPDNVAAFYCEPVSAAALPAYSPPAGFWKGLAERREQHGFLVCFDEIVTGMGRVGAWLGAHTIPFEPDIVAVGKGLGAGYAPLSGILCREHVYEPVAAGSQNFEHGHTWDGAPLLCAVGLAVLDALVEDRLVERVAERGPRLRDELEAALAGCELVREARGRGFLLGVELADPRDPEAPIPAEAGGSARVEEAALEHDLLVVASPGSADGYVGDQVLLAPAFTATDEELEQMVERIAGVLRAVERDVKDALATPGAAGR